MAPLAIVGRFVNLKMPHDIESSPARGSGGSHVAGKPSESSQAGELLAASEWVSLGYSPEWKGVALYEKLFGLSQLDFGRTRILDVGSGPISVFEPAAPVGAQIIPYDSLAREYNDLLPNKKFPITDELPQQRFDLVAALNCLDHMDDPDELLEKITEHLEDEGRAWIFVNIDQPYDPKLHPQDFKFWKLPFLVGAYLDVRTCGLVREGVLYPYAWWAVCGKIRHQQSHTFKHVWWVAKCGVQYLYFHAVRAVRKAARMLGIKRRH